MGISVVGLVFVVGVIAGLIGVFVVAIRRRRWSLVCFGLLIVAAIVGLVWTSGVRSRDWIVGTIYAEGENTIVVIDGCEVVLEGKPWPRPDVEFRMQVRGWTKSAGSGPDLYFDYRGGGENEITINQTKLRLRKSGREILIGDTFQRLELDQRLRVPVAGPR